MKSDRSIKIAMGLALLASLPLAVLSFLISFRIEHGRVLWFLPDSQISAICTCFAVLTGLAVGYVLFAVIRAFYSGPAKLGHFVAICISWVLGTFSLHCWVLCGLVGGMPSLASATRDAEDQTMVMNGLLTGYEGTLEDRARARAAMQVQMPGRGVTVPSVEQKLAIALKFQENAQYYMKSVVAAADDAERRTAKRAWISWATAAFTPAIVFALAAMRTRHLATRPQPCAAPNGDPAEPQGNSGVRGGPPSVS